MDQYLDIFIEESKEHLQSLNDQVLLLEKHPSEGSIVQEIFRSAHTLKGMAASMGYEDLTNLTHMMENVLDGIRNGELQVTQRLLDVLFESLDHLEEMILSIAAGGDGKKEVKATLALLQEIASGSPDHAVRGGNKEMPVQILYDSYEKEVIRQALNEGFSVYQTEIELREDCMLKAVRIHMAFAVIGQAGEIVKSVPAVDQLEQEEIEGPVHVTVVTMDASDTLEKRILSVSEIQNVTLIPVNGEALLSDEETADTQEKMEKAGKNLPIAAGNQSKTIRVNIDKLDSLVNLFEELVIDRGRLEKIAKDSGHTDLLEAVEKMARVSSELQDIILNIRMVPVDQVFSRFPRMIRSLAKELGKTVKLEISGAETELDRTIMDELGDSLVHLLRNSIDHGIESPEVRLNKGKTSAGTISLRAYHSGSSVFIEIEDDGAGVDRKKVQERAIQKGILRADQAAEYTDKQIYELLFAPGFSTAETVSDISGRGVGLDAVKSKIESLGGIVSVDSDPGAGTIFSIQLPLTLSILASLLVEAGEETYAIPLSSIVETALINEEEMFFIQEQKAMDFRDRVIPLFSLKEVYEIPLHSSKKANTWQPVVFIKKGNKTAGLLVDAFIGHQEIVLKSLGDYFPSVYAISGATILEDGQVALIMDCNALIS